MFTLGIGGRAQQAGTLLAATVLPIIFHRTLMPRSPVDHALITGTPCRRATTSSPRSSRPCAPPSWSASA
jgi:hypothetical protein